VPSKALSGARENPAASTVIECGNEYAASTMTNAVGPVAFGFNMLANDSALTCSFRPRDGASQSGARKEQLRCAAELEKRNRSLITVLET